MDKVLALLICTIFLLLSGCGLTPKQREGVTTFAQASEGIGDFTATTLSEMRASTIEMNEKNIAIRKADLNQTRVIFLQNLCEQQHQSNQCNNILQQLCEKDIDCSTSFKNICGDNTDCITKNKLKFVGIHSKALISVFCRKDQSCIDEFPNRIFFGAFSIQDLTARIGAAKALSSYGQLLQALVDDTQEAEISQASDELVGSINDVRDNSEDTLSTEQSESLGLAVEFIGGVIVEHKKAQAVKEIVPGTEGAVDILCDLLIADFDASGNGKLAAEYSNTIGSLKLTLIRGLRSEKNLQNREMLLQTSELAYKNDAKLQTVVKQSKKTLEQLKEANSQLVEVLKDDQQDLSSIKALVAQFQQLRNAVILIGTD